MYPTDKNDKPACLNKLSEDERAEVERYITDQTNNLFQSVDRMLDAATHVIGFLPNWLITRLTPKYIDPILSARTTDKLTLKQTLRISNALPIEYLGETAVFLTPQKAIDIIIGLDEKHATKLITWICQHNPSLAISLASELVQRGKATKLIAAFQLDDTSKAQLSDNERDTLESLAPHLK